MKEFVEQLIERLEEMQVQAEKDMQLSDTIAEANGSGGAMLAYGLAIGVIKEHAEEYAKTPAPYIPSK